MKRKCFLILTLILCIGTLLGVMCACNKTSDDTPSDNICRITEEFYAGESDAFYASIEKGRREATFIADGVARDVGDFVELTILPLKSNSYTTLGYTISDDVSTLSGEISVGKHGEFVASIALDFLPTKITVCVDEVEDEIELSSVLEGAISAEQAIEIAKNELQNAIDKEYDEGKPEREVYLKLISADRTTYFYYVSFIGEGVDYWAMLINPQTGDIVSRKH